MAGAGDVVMRGPVFNGSAQRALDDYEDDVELDLADEALGLVQDILAANLRNPTGFYQSRVRVSNIAGAPGVTDSGVVYGPWLEGVSHRNQTTRFKGYAAFRRAREAFAATAGDLAERFLPRYLSRMGG